MTRVCVSIYILWEVYPGQDYGGSGVYPRNATSEMGIHPGQDVNLSQGNFHTYSYLTAIQYRHPSIKMSMIYEETREHGGIAL